MKLKGAQSLANDTSHALGHSSLPSVLTSTMPYQVQHGNAISSLAAEEKMGTSRLETSLATLAAQICCVSTEN